MALIPSHCDPTVNQHFAFVGVRAGVPTPANMKSIPSLVSVCLSVSLSLSLSLSVCVSLSLCLCVCVSMGYTYNYHYMAGAGGGASLSDRRARSWVVEWRFVPSHHTVVECRLYSHAVYRPECTQQC